MSTISQELQKYLAQMGIEPESKIAEKLMFSMINNRQVEIEGFFINIRGFFKARQVLDEAFAHENSVILKIFHSEYTFHFLWEKLYKSLQHDFDTKNEETIRKEGFYLEAIEYWLHVVIEKISCP